MDKIQVRELMTNHDRDAEIYTDETLNHKEALVDFFEEKGFTVSPSDVIEKIGIPFIDEDSVAGVPAVMTISPLGLEVHVTAYHHRQWDYYINDIKDVTSCYHKNNFDMILLQTPLEEGLEKDSIQLIASILQNGQGYISFSTAENNSSAHGFIKATALEELDWKTESIEKFVKEMIGDLVKETQNGVYEMENGLSIYIGYA